MNERWEKIETLYHAARELDRQHQARFLDEACHSDAEIRQKVDDLLRQDREHTSFLNTSAAEEFANKLLAIANIKSLVEAFTRFMSAPDFRKDRL